MKVASPASSRVRRLVSSLRMIAAPVRCNVNDDEPDSGAPVALNPTSRTRQTSGPSTPTNPWATVATWGAPAVNSAGRALLAQPWSPPQGPQSVVRPAGRPSAPADPGQRRVPLEPTASPRSWRCSGAKRAHEPLPLAVSSLCLPFPWSPAPLSAGVALPDPAAGTQVGVNAGDASTLLPPATSTNAGAPGRWRLGPCKWGDYTFVWSRALPRGHRPCLN